MRTLARALLAAETQRRSNELKNENNPENKVATHN